MPEINLKRKILDMKKIEAIIRKEKFEEVRTALHEADIDFLSWWDVRGQGTEKQERIFRGAAYEVSSIERVNLSFVVRDINLEKSINAILKSAYTGESGDGRIFVIPIEQSIRIRTGERGSESLYDKK
jgi:nitrogen regulatory protein P-II 1